jgi:hypothetical protein
VAGRVFAFVGLDLDDPAADAFIEQAAADQVRRDVVDRAREELDAESRSRAVDLRSAIRT